MAQSILEWTAIVFLLIGTGLSVIGMVGFVRLPDVYTRLHATGKVSVFGLVSLLVAAILLTPLALGKGLLLIFFVLLAAPAVTHAIASAAYKAGLTANTKRDDLKGKVQRASGKGV